MGERLNITGYSTALFSTWIFVEQLGLLLDAGDGICAGLLQKSRKIKKVAVTHPDRDHVTGLLQLQQLNAQDGVPEIFYPADSGSFPALAKFCRDFDPGRGNQVSWTPVKPGDQHDLGRSYRLRVLANGHFHDKPGMIKSVSYIVGRQTRKLREEFEGVPQNRLAELSKQFGKDHLMQSGEERVLGYSGDTDVASPATWAGCEVLIHEATFLDRAGMGDREDRHQHSFLPDVLRMAAEAKPKCLVLNHFSSRYSAKEISVAIRKYASESVLSFPVYAFLPGEITRNILEGTPVWMP